MPYAAIARLRVGEAGDAVGAHAFGVLEQLSEHLGLLCRRGRGPPLGMNFRHAFWAAWNWGEPGAAPLLELMWKVPFELGSGKSGKPFERRHSANLRSWA